MRDKPLVFLSHASEEGPVALVLQEQLRETFLGALDVFNASDRGSISAGSRWRERLIDALASAKCVVLLCSTRSLGSSWVNFEAGGGWVAGAEVIPCCIGGLRRDQLPRPYSDLQAVELYTSDGIEDLLRVLARVVELEMPNIDYTRLADDIAKAAAPPKADQLTKWMRRTDLLPDRYKGQSMSGTVRIRDDLEPVDPLAAREFKEITKGTSLEVKVVVNGLPSAKRAFFVGADLADVMIDLAEQSPGSDFEAEVTLRCLGSFKRYHHADIPMFELDEDRYTYYMVGYFIEELSAAGPS